MPEYLAPGVYIEEVSSGIKPIEGVSTSTAGFVGMTERGQSAPQLVTSWPDFQRKYGGIINTSLSYLPLAVKGFFDNGGQRVYIARVTGSQAQEGSKSFNSEEDDTPVIKVKTIGPGEWGDRVFIRIMKATSPRKDPNNQEQDDPSQFRLTVLYYAKAPGDAIKDPFSADNADPRNLPVIEDYDNLDSSPNRPNYVISKVNSQSRLIHLEKINEEMKRPKDTQGFEKLDGATDGADPLTAGRLKGKEAESTGLAGLGLIDQVSILCIPDEVHPSIGELGPAEVRTAIEEQCNKTGDRFAVLQLREGSMKTEEVKKERNSLPDTSRAGVYHPWVRVANPLTQDSVLIPPGGHVCGIFARSDIERGVHKAPANEAIRGIINADLSNNRRPLSVIYTKGNQDVLNPLSVNLIRDFRGDQRGIRLWGSRTLSSDPEWRYVNVRRLFLFVEESIDEGTQWVVFEPNNHQTWAAVRRNITAFLNTVWKSGALFGLTQDEAFFVKCDRTTMTEDDINNGRLICLIGIAPVKPAEFVIFRISQKTIDAA